MKSKEYCEQLEEKINELTLQYSKLLRYLSRLEIFEGGMDSLDELLEEILEYQKNMDSFILDCLGLLYEKTARELEILHDAGEVIFHSPQKLQEKFMRFGMEIPSEEMNRMWSEIARVDLEELKVKCAKLKKYTEGNEPPILMVLPQKVLIKGELVECTISSLKEKIWPMVRSRISGLIDVFISYQIADKIKERPWIHNLTAYSSALIKKTRNESYEKQIEFVNNHLGSESKKNAEMYPVLVFHYMISGRIPLAEEWMRLNECDSSGSPMSINYQSGIDMNLVGGDSKNPDPHMSTGLGAFFTFSEGFTG